MLKIRSEDPVYLVFTRLTKVNWDYYTLQSPSVFSLAKSLQLILGNSATYRLFINLNNLYGALCMISKSNVKCTDSNVKFADSEVRMASRFASSTQQEIEKLLEDKV